MALGLRQNGIVRGVEGVSLVAEVSHGADHFPVAGVLESLPLQALVDGVEALAVQAHHRVHQAPTDGLGPLQHSSGGIEMDGNQYLLEDQIETGLENEGSAVVLSLEENTAMMVVGETRSARPSHQQHQMKPPQLRDILPLLAYTGRTQRNITM